MQDMRFHNHLSCLAALWKTPQLESLESFFCLGLSLCFVLQSQIPLLLKSPWTSWIRSGLFSLVLFKKRLVHAFTSFRLDCTVLFLSESEQQQSLNLQQIPNQTRFRISDLFLINTSSWSKDFAPTVRSLWPLTFLSGTRGHDYWIMYVL